jgi:hypothetical protein
VIYLRPIHIVRGSCSSAGEETEKDLPCMRIARWRHHILAVRIITTLFLSQMAMLADSISIHFGKLKGMGRIKETQTYVRSTINNKDEERAR